MDNSNLRFCGAYLEGTTFPPSSTAGQFTNSSKDVNRAWIPNVGTMRDKGWGIVFWYVGYSIGGGEPIPTSLASAGYADRGRLHAQHAKTIMSTVSPAFDGAVVFLDNEDGIGTNVSSLFPYYTAFFDELQTPGPGMLPAMRAGLYAHNPIASAFLSSRPSVLVWEVSYDTGSMTSQPFDSTANPLQVQPKQTLDPMKVVTGGQNWTAWPVGRQFRPFSGAMPATGSPLATGIVGFTPISSWDYDTSAVRDPSYPSGEPRIALGVGPTVIEGRFTPRNADPPQMTVDMIDPTGHLNVPLIPAQFIEPEAPLASATFPGATITNVASFIFTTATPPTLDVGVFDTGSRTWLNTGTSQTVTPRRLRALAYATFAADDLQVFFIGSDGALYGIRSTGGGPWGAPAVMGAPLQAHPFASLAATSRAATSVDVFTINSSGLLTTAFWAGGGAPWPGSNSQVIEPGPAIFLPTTSLAAVSAAANKLHVFGVGADLHLHYFEFTDPTWGGVATLGGATDFVSPHSRVAAYVVSPARIEIAVLSDAGKVRIHALAASGTTWTEQLPYVEFDTPAAIPPAPRLGARCRRSSGTPSLGIARSRGGAASAFT